MLRIINSSDAKAVRALLTARQSRLKESLSKARRILEDVRREGDRALIRYTRRFDGVDLRKTGFTDRKSTRLNSSHGYISYAVFCLKKKTTKFKQITIRQSLPRRQGA